MDQLRYPGGYPVIQMPASWVKEGMALIAAARVVWPEQMDERAAKSWVNFFETHNDGKKHPDDVFKNQRRLRFFIEHGKYPTGDWMGWYLP